MLQASVRPDPKAPFARAEITVRGLPAEPSRPGFQLRRSTVDYIEPNLDIAGWTRSDVVLQPLEHWWSDADRSFHLLISGLLCQHIDPGPLKLRLPAAASEIDLFWPDDIAVYDDGTLPPPTREPALPPVDEAAAARQAAAAAKAEFEAEAARAQARREAELQAEREAEAARIEAEQRAEAARIEAARLEAEHIEAERIEAERIEAERIEAERIEAERIEAARLEAERQAQIHAEQQAAAEQARQQAEQAEQAAKAAAEQKAALAQLAAQTVWGQAEPTPATQVQQPPQVQQPTIQQPAAPVQPKPRRRHVGALLGVVAALVIVAGLATRTGERDSSDPSTRPTPPPLPPLPPPARPGFGNLTPFNQPPLDLRGALDRVVAEAPARERDGGFNPFLSLRPASEIIAQTSSPESLLRYGQAKLEQNPPDPGDADRLFEEATKPRFGPSRNQPYPPAFLARALLYDPSITQNINLPMMSKPDFAESLYRRALLAADSDTAALTRHYLDHLTTWRTQHAR